MSYKILYVFSPEHSPCLERSPQHPPGDILLGTCRPEEILHTSLVDSQEMFPEDLLLEDSSVPERSHRDPGNILGTSSWEQGDGGILHTALQVPPWELLETIDQPEGCS